MKNPPQPAAQTKPATASAAAPAPRRDPLVITVDEHSRLTPAQKQAFRDAHGTVCANEALGPDNAPVL